MEKAPQLHHVKQSTLLAGSLLVTFLVPMTDLETDLHRLHEPAFLITFAHTNAGSVNGTEVRVTFVIYAELVVYIIRWRASFSASQMLTS